MTEKESFNNAGKWLKEAKSKSKNQHFILVGHKNDLKNRVVSTEEGKAMAQKLKCSDYIETSALTGDFVDEVFTQLGETILRMNL